MVAKSKVNGAFKKYLLRSKSPRCNAQRAARIGAMRHRSQKSTATSVRERRLSITATGGTGELVASTEVSVHEACDIIVPRRKRGALLRCLTECNALHCHALHRRLPVALASERMKAMRDRRRARGLRELRLIVPDARSKAVRRRLAREVTSLDRSLESEALRWIESVSEFDGR